MKAKIYQIKISLRDSKPEIWRRVLISSNLLLPNLQNVIQIVMGWEDAHLHHFIKGRVFYTNNVEKEKPLGGMNEVNYSNVKISELLQKEKQSIFYEYDFGDGWDHDVLLEKINDIGLVKGASVCITGENKCPPEDCGGMWGYENLLNIQKDPNHEEYEDCLEWLGEGFNPSHFDKSGVNEALKCL